MAEVLNSGKRSFKIEVPYKLIETGQEGRKPLIVYLHGYDQNIDLFHEKVKPLFELRAFHLFIRGPYPIYDRSGNKQVEHWGAAWYLYDGDQHQFVRSLELSSEFIQEIIDDLLIQIEVSRICLLGYSMGAYLAGYFGMSRWKHVNELIMVGGRLKTEVFENREHHYGHMNVLALHGRDDRRVKAETQEKSVERFGEWGARTTFKELSEGHRLTPAYIWEITDWLKSQSY